MLNIIDGKALANEIKDEVVDEIESISHASILNTRRPSLAIILIGEREDSKLYVEMKEREAKKVGIDTSLYKCEKNISEEEALKMIDFLNKDDEIDAILVQLPLPERYNTDTIVRAIDPQKDVDRFHPDNVKKLFQSCNHNHVMPPVYAAVIEMLKSINFEYEGTNICLISNSDLFGKGLKKVLECKNSKVINANVNDADLLDKMRHADLIITAIGKPRFIKADMIKEDVVIIDIGITKEGKKVVGDVDFEDVSEKVSYITPVPGGVGPMTIAMLFKNTLELYKNKYPKGTSLGAQKKEDE